MAEDASRASTGLVETSRVTYLALEVATFRQRPTVSTFSTVRVEQYDPPVEQSAVQSIRVIDVGPPAGDDLYGTIESVAKLRVHGVGSAVLSGMTSWNTFTSRQPA